MFVSKNPFPLGIGVCQRNDFKKKEKHRILYNSFNGSETSCPNYFYYACPVGLIHPDNVPPYAGLLYINVEKPNRFMVFVKKSSIAA